MDSPFHSLLVLSEGTALNPLLLEYYFFAAQVYSLWLRACGSVRTLIGGEPVYDTCSPGGRVAPQLSERVPALNVIREVEDMLRQHGFLTPEDSERAYNCEDADAFAFDFAKMREGAGDFAQFTKPSDGDTTFICDDNQVGEDDISFSDLDGLVSLMRARRE